MSLPTVSPAEALQISPEALEVANAYLELQKIDAVADALDLPVDAVTSYLERKDVRAYINQVFFNLGFNNRFKLRGLMDTLIQKKLQEMDEAGVGSSKDITELIELSAKLTLQFMDKEIELRKLDIKANSSGVKTQTNIQINDAGGGSKYEQLMNKILNGTVQQGN